MCHYMTSQVLNVPSEADANHRTCHKLLKRCKFANYPLVLSMPGTTFRVAIVSNFTKTSQAYTFTPYTLAQIPLRQQIGLPSR